DPPLCRPFPRSSTRSLPRPSPTRRSSDLTSRSDNRNARYFRCTSRCPAVIFGRGRWSVTDHYGVGLPIFDSATNCFRWFCTLGGCGHGYGGGQLSVGLAWCSLYGSPPSTGVGISARDYARGVVRPGDELSAVYFIGNVRGLRPWHRSPFERATQVHHRTFGCHRGSNYYDFGI